MSLYFAAAYLGVAVPSIGLGLLADIWGQVPAATTIMGILGACCIAMGVRRNPREDSRRLTLADLSGRGTPPVASRGRHSSLLWSRASTG